VTLDSSPRESSASGREFTAAVLEFQIFCWMCFSGFAFSQFFIASAVKLDPRLCCFLSCACIINNTLANIFIECM
jgi:hypothetical protein